MAANALVSSRLDYCNAQTTETCSASRIVLPGLEKIVPSLCIAALKMMK